MNRYIQQLIAVFKSSANKHQAHERSQAILQEMSGDSTVLCNALEGHVLRRGGLCGGNYPVLSALVESNPYFDLVANSWIPLPDRSTDVSTKAIHHHGTMLMTSVTAFGPGYEHWLFTQPAEVDPELELFEMDVLNRGPHPLHSVGFVDAYEAHVPMYVSDLTVTLALWSNRERTTWRDYVKRIRLLQRNSAALRKLATKAGLAESLELKNVEYFDFHPSESGFVGMRDRTEFPLGPNADYLHSLFYVLQRTGNDALTPVVARAAEKERLEEPALFDRLLGDLEKGHEIEPRLSQGHYDVPFANFRNRDIEGALEAQSRKAAPHGG